MIAYITEINPLIYKNFIKSGFVLLDLYSDWCQPCKTISPIVDQISSEYQGKLSVGKLDIEMNQEIVADLGIRNIPTLILYKDGEIIEKTTGVVSKQQIEEMIDKHLV